LIASKTAALLLYPSFRLSEAHSIITIIVSMAIHRVKTREKLVKKFREYPRVSKIINVPKKASGSKSEAIIDSIVQTNSSITINTKTIVVRAVLERLS